MIIPQRERPCYQEVPVSDKYLREYCKYVLTGSTALDIFLIVDGEVVREELKVILKRSHMKRTFVVPDEKEQVYEKFKSLVPEVSAKLVELMEEFNSTQEAMQAGMSIQTTYEGKNDTKNDIFSGKSFKFKGVLIAEGVQKDSFQTISSQIYLTLKGKLLVTYTALDHFHTETIKHTIFETYDDLVNRGKLSKETLALCSEYLSLNSDLRHFEVLDV